MRIGFVGDNIDDNAKEFYVRMAFYLLMISRYREYIAALSTGSKTIMDMLFALKKEPTYINSQLKKLEEANMVFANREQKKSVVWSLNWRKINQINRVLQSHVGGGYHILKEIHGLHVQFLPPIGETN